VIARFEGTLPSTSAMAARLLWLPSAHEDDAQRAVRADWGWSRALGQLNTRLGQEQGVHLACVWDPYRAGGGGRLGGRHPAGAVGAGRDAQPGGRLQGSRAPNTLVISAATLQAPRGILCLQSLGTTAPEGLCPAAGGLSGAV